MNEDIPRLFYSIQGDNPNLGAYCCLMKALENKNVGQRMARFYLRNLVPQDDYAPEMEDQLVDDLVRVSQTLL